MAAVGGLLFAVFVEGGAASRATRRYVLTASALAAVVAAIGIGVHGAHLTLTPVDAFLSPRPWLAGAATSLAPATAVALGGLALIVIAIRRIGRPFFQWVAIFGSAAAASSLSATGEAALTVPFLVKRSLTIHQGIGTASAVGWPLAFAGAFGYALTGWGRAGLPEWSVGFVYLPALAWIAAASMALAPVGARVAHRTPGRTLKRVFAIVLFGLAINMLVSTFR